MIDDDLEDVANEALAAIIETQATLWRFAEELEVSDSRVQTKNRHLRAALRVCVAEYLQKAVETMEDYVYPEEDDDDTVE